MIDFRYICFLPLFLFCGTWAEKTLSQMTLDEKIGQLFVAPICPMRGEDHQKDWEILLGKFHIGNAIVKQSDPVTQVRCLNTLQKKSKRPLLIAADAEWGLAMRMKDTIAFPKNRILGAVENLDLLEEFGKEVGREAKRVGVHLVLAPVADVNNNPENPIIGARSFGKEPERVADCVAKVIRGIQSAGVFATAKHFPGHGDTKVDSHAALPFISHDWKRLDQIELVPFKRA
ncbi:MAG: glycoside hydrolase family 3 protein, partial [Chlamydiae bacterium]|nr:glycoside hydrolase family 3 protein [Chlamydiota bacterium]